MRESNGNERYVRTESVHEALDKKKCTKRRGGQVYYIVWMYCGYFGKSKKDVDSHVLW